MMSQETITEGEGQQPDSYLAQVITRVREDTQSNRLVWASINPSTFACNRSSGGESWRASIQKAMSSKPSTASVLGLALDLMRGDVFRFQLSHGDDVVVSIDSDERAGLKRPLEELFEAARVSSDRRMGDALERFLGCE
jgi:hypothetical protein